MVLCTWSPAAIGGRHWHVGRTLVWVYRSLPVSSVPSVAPALAPINHIYIIIEFFFRLYFIHIQSCFRIPSSPWWSFEGSSRSPLEPPWWTKCMDWRPPGNSWSGDQVLPVGWSRPLQSWARSGRRHGHPAGPWSPPESCTLRGLSDLLQRSQTSCWRLKPSWQRWGTDPRPGWSYEQELKDTKLIFLTWGKIPFFTPFWSAPGPPEASSCGRQSWTAAGSSASSEWHDEPQWPWTAHVWLPTAGLSGLWYWWCPPAGRPEAQHQRFPVAECYKNI